MQVSRADMHPPYPADASRKAKIHSVLDWHHLNSRCGAAGYVLNTVLAPLLGLPLNVQAAAAEAEKVLVSSLSTIENIWLKGDGLFLLGSFQPSIADLSLVCEIMQLQLLDEKDHDRIIGPYKKVQQWIESKKMQVALPVKKSSLLLSSTRLSSIPSQTNYK